jgi:hypothetical protein
VLRSSGVRKRGKNWPKNAEKMEKRVPSTVPVDINSEARGKVCEHVYPLGTLNLLIMITRDCKKR